MEPHTKKRRLAPKVAEKPIHEPMQESRRYDYQYPQSMHDASQPQPDQSDFDAFARHLQDAASKIYSHINRSPYNNVTVQLLRWEEDPTFEPELQALQKLFTERFNYRAESWNIPSGPNPGVKLSMQLAQHIDFARAEDLLIIYYAGYGFVGGDNNSYWACNSREDSSKLKWDNVRGLIEDAQCDVLLLLDSCAVADGSASNTAGVKQGIAAYSREQVADNAPRSFTYNLIESLQKLSAGPAFTVPRLYEDIAAQKHLQIQEQLGTTNGNKKAASGSERLPVVFSLTPNNMQSIVLAPYSRHPPTSQIASPLGSPDAEARARGSNGDHTYISNGSPRILFEDSRALVRISVQGDPTPDMVSFRRWLANIPGADSKIEVEGIFYGPPTLVLASMPVSIFQTISQTLPADRATFLGYVKSHNMLGDYQRLLGQSPMAKPSARELEDGRLLVEAAAAYSPSVNRHDPSPQGMHASGLLYPITAPPPLPDRNVGSDRKDEDTEEMHEAAIQLKALSHIRHINQDQHGDRSALNHPHPIPLPTDSTGHRSARDESISSQEVDSAEDGLYNSEYHSPASSRAKPRRSIQKQGPKQDTRCSLCSHAPFKDSSSLRKHIAAAHTRPFPCAFAFAGCNSTFGSKNEWKRHIASQHLCLTYYRCSSCPQSTVEGKGNEFNRKDLFTQHLRRMHAPFAIKKAIAKGDSKLQLEWETHVKEMQASCLVIRRSPPTRSACPKADCSNVFEGAGSWDDWTEHVGRHMEKGEASRLGVDRLLAKWALDEGIIERKDDGEYRLCGSDREGGNVIGSVEEEHRPEEMAVDDTAR